MKTYKCDICNKIFKQKSHFTNHKNRKFPCKMVIEKNCEKIEKNCNEKMQENNNLPNDGLKRSFEALEHSSNDNQKMVKNTKCVYCGQLFKQRYNMLVHMRNNCKAKKEIENEKENIFKQLLKEMKELKQSNKEFKETNNKIIKENKKLRGTIYKLKVNNTTNNNNITNNGTVNYNNIKLIAFGKEHENMKTFKKSDILNAINGFGTEIALTKLIHWKIYIVNFEILKKYLE